MAENMTIFPTGLTYSRNTKAPLMDMQVFETLALAQAYVDNKDQTAYVGLTVSVVNDGANNGLYYVEQIADADHATGVLTKVGSDTAQDVADLKAAVEALETAVGDENSGIAADVAANAEAIEANAEEIAKKANSFTVGNGLSYADNKINIVVSAEAGNSLSVDENGLYVAVPEVEVPEYSLVSVESPADAYAAQYEFKKDGVVLNTINIPKDQFLKDASYDAANDELVFVFNTAAGENTTRVSVADLVDTYTAGDYITITDNAIAVDYEAVKAKINEDLVNPLSVNLSNLSATVTTVSGTVDTLVEAKNDHATRIGVLETAKTDLEARVVVLEGVDHPSKADVDQLKTDVSGLQASVSGLEAAVSVIKVKDVDTTASNGINLSLAADGKIGVNVDIDTLAAKVIEKHVVEFDADTIKTTDAVGSNEAGASVQTVLENLESRIQAAVSGGVTSVAAGNGIVVDSTDPNNPKVSVNVVSGSSLKATTDGLDLVWEQI